jgi:hypothetical protein
MGLVMNRALPDTILATRYRSCQDYAGRTVVMHLLPQRYIVRPSGAEGEQGVSPATKSPCEPAIRIITNAYRNAIYRLIDPMTIDELVGLADVPATTITTSTSMHLSLRCWTSSHGC